MDNINMPPFYIGQKVVAIKNSKSGATYKKGEIHTVLNILKCDCGRYLIDIGFKVIQGTGTRCDVCQKSVNKDYVWYCDSRSFAPAIQEQEFKQTTYSKVLEEVPMCDN